MIRTYRETDESGVGVLLRAAWPNDPVLIEISSLHGVEVDDGSRWRRTLVAVEDGDLVGCASLAATARHPTFSFFAVFVAPAHRRRGIATALLAELRRGYDHRPLLARVRETDDAGLAFLHARGFGPLMRACTATVDPNDPDVVAWIEAQHPIEVERPAARDDVARAHEQAYGRVHAGWAPRPDRPLEESLLVFCGEGWLPESATLARHGRDVIGVGSFYGPPSVFAGDGLFMIADTLSADGRALRSLVAVQLNWARGRRSSVSLEADEANTELWQLIHELPARFDAELRLLAGGRPFA